MNARYESRDNNIARASVIMCVRARVCIRAHTSSACVHATLGAHVVKYSRALMLAHCARELVTAIIFFESAGTVVTVRLLFLRRSGNTLSSRETLSSAVIAALPPRTVL